VFREPQVDFVKDDPADDKVSRESPRHVGTSVRLVGVAATILIAHRLAPSDFGVVMLGAAIAGQSLVAVLNYRASVTLGVAPALDGVVLRETWTRRNS